MRLYGPGSTVRLKSMPGGLGLDLPTTPAAFEPPDITGNILWLKADAFVGKSDNTTVGLWEDLSPVAENVGQSTEANKPIYRTNILNGMPIVRGDGSNDLLSRSGTAPGANNWMMWGVWSNRATGTTTQVPFYCGAGGTNGFGPALRTTGTFKGALFGSVAWLNSSATEATGFETWVLQRRSGTTRLWVNGGAPILNSASVPVAPNSNTYLFYNNVHTAADVDIAECGIHDGSASLAEAEQLGSYLAARWGLSWTTATDS